MSTNTNNPYSTSVICFSLKSIHSALLAIDWINNFTMGNCLNWLSPGGAGEALSGILHLAFDFAYIGGSLFTADAPRKLKVGNYTVKVVALRGQGGFSDVFEACCFRPLS